MPGTTSLWSVKGILKCRRYIYWCCFKQYYMTVNSWYMQRNEGYFSQVSLPNSYPVLWLTSWVTLAHFEWLNSSSIDRLYCQIVPSNWSPEVHQCRLKTKNAQYICTFYSDSGNVWNLEAIFQITFASQGLHKLLLMNRVLRSKCKGFLIR